MDKLECPNCHQKTIPLWRKMCLGPATSTTCANCGASMSVPYAAMLAAVPFLGAALVAQAVAWPVAVTLVIAGAVALFALYYKFVPLIVKT